MYVMDIERKHTMTAILYSCRCVHVDCTPVSTHLVREVVVEVRDDLDSHVCLPSAWRAHH